MLALSNRYRYFLYYGKTDFRKGFDGLSGLFRNEMGLDPTDGEIYVFVNRRRNQLKLLTFEADGFCLYHKKLVEGAFEMPLYDVATGSAVITEEQLSLILKGISLKSVRKRERYQFRRA